MADGLTFTSTHPMFILIFLTSHTIITLVISITMYYETTDNNMCNIPPFKLNGGTFHIILSIPHNIVMDMNHVMRRNGCCTQEHYSFIEHRYKSHVDKGKRLVINFLLGEKRKKGKRLVLVLGGVHQ